MDFRGKKFAVLGFGQEGASAVKFLLEKGAKVSVFDVRGEDKFDKAELAELQEKEVFLNLTSYPDDFSEFDFVVRSPGIRLTSSIMKKAQDQEAKITSVTKIFFELCPCPIVGVTGTKGKGTTSSLIYEMLKEQGVDAYLGGNIGLPPLEFLSSLKSTSCVVLELSSFQLQDLTKSPQISVFLMVTSEHLDYHNDVNEYVDAKRNILRFQKESDFAVLNRDYPASNESDVYTQAQVYYVSRERSAERGCYVQDGYIVIKPDGQADGPEGALAQREIKVVPTSEILLPGKHNYENVCAAALAAYLAGVEIKYIASVLKTFRGLEHRLELVRVVNGVRYYDDSFSTTPETAIAAIEAFQDPEILILGGSSKKSDFTELGKTIREAKNIKAIIGIGEEWPKIKSELKTQNTELKIVEDCFNMKEVVEKAREIAEIGDVVLLSPACASFGMFKNYKDRGNQFKNVVNELQ